MKKHDYIHTRCVTAVAALAAVLAAPRCALAAERPKPYREYTGTVHQFGFIAGVYNTSNPNFSGADGEKQSFCDWALGAAYTMHDYVTRQFTFDVMTSVTLLTASYLDNNTASHAGSRQKIVWPVDCRFYIGPSEDFQAYIGTGLQWNMFRRSVGDYDIVRGAAPSKTIHQLGGNTAVGLNIFGPQNYMFHLNIGAKLHYLIADNDDIVDGATLIDLSKDRDCIVLTGGITIDLDRKKNACLMLSYDYPLATPKSSCAGRSFFKNTQTVSAGLMFHIGGTRK